MLVMNHKGKSGMQKTDINMETFIMVKIIPISHHVLVQMCTRLSRAKCISSYFHVFCP